MKLINLALANSRKSKSATISLLIFTLIAALLLNIGLMVITQINPFYDKKVKQLDNPHVAFVSKDVPLKSVYEQYLEKDSRVSETETESVIQLDATNYQYGDGELSSTVLMYNAEAKRNIAPITFIETVPNESAKDIYLPYSFKTNGGYSLGNSFTITYLNKDYRFRVAGFFETTMMGTHNFGVMKFVLPEKSYKEWTGIQPESVLLSIIMKDPTQSSELKNKFIQEFKPQTEGAPSILGLDIETVKSVNTLTINIISALLVAFAFIVLVVLLVVIKFRVSISMEEGMANIGALKALGYTSRQLLGANLLQYTFVAFGGGIIGVLLSYMLNPYIGKIISSLSGLIWTQTIDLPMNVGCMFLIMILVWLVVFLSSLKLRKVMPVEALRGGTQTHNFRKNFFPLETTGGGLPFVLALKSSMVHAKHNVMILIIVMALTFASIFSVVLHYNVATDKTAFVDLFGVEPANVYIAVKPGTNSEQLLRDIEAMDHVRKVNRIDYVKTEIDGQTIYTNITDDYGQLENNIIYEGRQPKYENELSISWVVANQLKKGIGDAVEVTYAEQTKKYLITGISQTMTYSGQVAALTWEGIRKLQPDYQGSTLHVYLQGISNKQFMKAVTKQYGEQIAETVNIDENIESQTGMYTAAVFAVMLMVLAITVVVVVMILLLVIQTMVLKRRKEFGVMKAIGYTNLQLMNQISLSFLPVVLLGVTIGGVLGYFYTNPMLALFFSGAGVKQLDFIIHVPSVLKLCIGILLLSYIASMIVSRRIKKISAYGLISE